MAELVHASAAAMLEHFAGDREGSLRVLRAAFGRPGNAVSREAVWVVECGGEVAGAMAACPATELERRARRFLRVLLWRTPPWTWRQSVRLHRLGATIAPPPPPGSLYVDSLATRAHHRRSGVARALLAEAEREAARRDLAAVSLETSRDNRAARGLYESAGFALAGRRLPRSGLPGLAAYVKAL